MKFINCTSKNSIKFLPLIGPSNVSINARKSFRFNGRPGLVFIASSSWSSSLFRVTTTAIVMTSARMNTALNKQQEQNGKLTYVSKWNWIYVMRWRLKKQNRWPQLTRMKSKCRIAIDWIDWVWFVRSVPELHMMSQVLSLRIMTSSHQPFPCFSSDWAAHTLTTHEMQSIKTNEQLNNDDDIFSAVFLFLEIRLMIGASYTEAQIQLNCLWKIIRRCEF